LSTSRTGVAFASRSLVVRRCTGTSAIGHAAVSQVIHGQREAVAFAMLADIEGLLAEAAVAAD
jgi:hypothetical protein